MVNKMFLTKMKENLLAQRSNLLAKTIEDQNIHVDTDGDEFDEIQGNLLIEMHNQLYVRNNYKLASIDNALKQIDEETYGICQDCGELIPERRLLINPYTETCVECAEEREIEEKQRKREQI